MTRSPLPNAAPDLDALLAVATELASEAADLVVGALDRERTEIATKSTGTDMVTEMDRASEALIVAGIRRARPDDAILAEEGGGNEGTSGVRWVVDPLDGTTNYLYGHPGFAVSIAVEVDGSPAVGVVADPLHADLFSATRGGGARRNGRRITCSGKHELATALVSTGFAYEPDRRRAQASVLQAVIGEVRDIRRGGAAAVDLCWVACGRLDAFYERGLHWWDLAAGSLIASEAGARVEDLDDGPPSPEFALAAAPGVFGPLRDLLRSAGAAAA